MYVCNYSIYNIIFKFHVRKFLNAFPSRVNTKVILKHLRNWKVPDDGVFLEENLNLLADCVVIGRYSFKLSVFSIKVPTPTTGSDVDNKTLFKANSMCIPTDTFF